MSDELAIQEADAFAEQWFARCPNGCDFQVEVEIEDDDAGAWRVSAPTQFHLCAGCQQLFSVVFQTMRAASDD